MTGVAIPHKETLLSARTYGAVVSIINSQE